MSGYDPSFIGPEFNIPLPVFEPEIRRNVLKKPGELRDSIYDDHIHFTLVMNKARRTLIYAASNIDQSKFKPKVTGEGKRAWSFSDLIGADNQIGNEYYRDRSASNGDTIPNPYDRGHMVMRSNNMWGDTKRDSDQAGKATFVYANAALQQENLNRDEWKSLEMNVFRTFADDANDKLSVFTGPIYGSLDRHVNLSDRDTARVPSGFFKVLCFKNLEPVNGDALGVLAFAIFQDEEVLRDKKGASRVKINTAYQVTISEIQDWTGINFGQRLYDQNPLFYHDRPGRNALHCVPFTPERIPTISMLDPVSHHQEIRCDAISDLFRPIVIQSAMINPNGKGASNEWISLHNRTSKNVKVDNWVITDKEGRKGKLKGGIPPGESLRIKGGHKGTIKLANLGGGLILHDGHGCIIDHATWSGLQVKTAGKGYAVMFYQPVT
ncbi:DNA/RNA non-specific endonuclease [Granulosicoccus sp.]|nr:DNA/RNA non-specific endonuclease [Granulosicoccus sp.]MDB4223359.1 DNA/RNA non-specific endonuclease [Granulosicoccus sp.]